MSSASFNLLQEYEHMSSSDIRSFVYELSNVIVNSASPFSCVTTNDYFFYGIDGNYVLPNYLMNGIKASRQRVFHVAVFFYEIEKKA